jgi:NAD+ synthase (glutamine-hydrolysing)
MIGDCRSNGTRIVKIIFTAAEHGSEVILFPELCLTGYTCGDLFMQQLLLDEALETLHDIVSQTASLDIISIVGMPLALPGGRLLNVAVVVQRGNVMGFVPKTYLPNYKEFYEERWFTSAVDVPEKSITLWGESIPIGSDLLFECRSFSFGIEICEDLWAPVPPSSVLAMKGADIIFNPSADDASIGKYAYLQSLISQQSARCIAGYVFSSCGMGESTTDVVFDGNVFIFENGTLLEKSRRFPFTQQLVMSEIDVERLRTERRINTTFAACRASVADKQEVRVIAVKEPQPVPLFLTRTVSPHPFVPQGVTLDERCEEIFSIQVAALAQRLVHTHAKSVVLGISGGLDSTLALLVCVKTFDKLQWSRQGIIGITMPGFGTTDTTYRNAMTLMKLLGVTIREISIRDACLQHFTDIGHDPKLHDVVYENTQARERTKILMDVANQTGGLVIGTGDLSELALGWATYNGDHMSMYGVNVSVPKTLVKHLVKWVANSNTEEVPRATLLNIADTPISPELLPADEEGHITQRTEDLVGPYELHDFFLYYFLRFGFRPKKLLFLARYAFGESYDEETIKHWLTVFCRRFFSQQFKRSCLPDGPKVGSVSLSPRGDWRMPSDASVQAWLNELA